MTELIDFSSYGVRATLRQLLKDKTTKKNIIWATNNYISYGLDFTDSNEIREFSFRHGFRLDARTAKSEQTQLERTRKKAEVFTPAWIVNQMNNYQDQDWFGRAGVFNLETDYGWQPVSNPIQFPAGKSWQDYVLLRKLEITCGEAPYLVSRYDVATGEMINPLARRVGILDRKLRIVDENTSTKEEWISWAIKAVQSTYGYEFQGDNLLIARINILLTFIEYYEERFDEEVDQATLKTLANIIAWNIWQMDGLTDTLPTGALDKTIGQENLWDEMIEEVEIPTYARVYDWRANRSQVFKDIKGES